MRKLSLPLRPLTPRTEGRTQTAERIDRLGLSLLAAAVCAAFFYWLWRSAGPALLAGGALSAILLPPLLRGEKRACLGRRKSARRAQRAEAGVEALLLCEKTDAALKAASWLQKAYPLEALSPREGFCTGFLRHKRAAVFFLAQIRTATADDLLPLLRAARAENVQVCLICAACGFDEHAKTLANAAKPSVFLFDRKADCQSDPGKRFAGRRSANGEMGERTLAPRAARNRAQTRVLPAICADFFRNAGGVLAKPTCGLFGLRRGERAAFRLQSARAGTNEASAVIRK